MDNMGEATVKRMKYTKKLDDLIISHENQILALYLERIRQYVPLFEKNGFFLKTGLMWKCFPNETVMLQRTVFRSGYQCYVYCTVLKDGNEVQAESTDGEADFYPVSAAWLISSVFKRFFKLNIEIYVDIDEVDASLKKFLVQLGCAG